MTRHRISLAIGSLALVAALAPAPLRPDEPDLKALVAKKIEAARKILDLCREFLVAPPGEKSVPPQAEVAEQIRYWSRQLADARLEAAATKAERVAILAEEVEQASGLEKALKDLLTGEATAPLAVSKATFSRLDAEIRLAREKAAQ